MPLSVLIGHREGVWDALALADGWFLSWSSGTFDKDITLRLWGGDGMPLAVLKGHTQAVKGALVLADGRFLSWSEDSTLRLWTSNGMPLNILKGHTQAVKGALVLADGRFLSWSEDSTLRLWASNGMPLTVLKEHTQAVKGALVLTDGCFLSWDWDSNYHLWAANGTPLDTISDPAEQRRLHYEGRQAMGEVVPPIVWENEVRVLMGYNRKSGALICSFIGDTELRDNAIAQSVTGTVAAGGTGGKLHFLRPNAALRRLMQIEDVPPDDKAVSQ
jgi:hypothetical protein